MGRVDRGRVPTRWYWMALSLVISGLTPSDARAQAAAGPRFPPGGQGSGNVRLLSHLPLGRAFTMTNLEIEQELSRPYVYAGRMFVHGMDVIEIKDPTRPRVIYSWRIENRELHQGIGGMDNKYFKYRGRYYDVLATQFGQGGPDADLGAVVWDVTGLPDTAAIREVGRIRAPDVPGGFHTVFAYKHSDGRVLLFASNGQHANVYDMVRFLAGDPAYGLIGQVPVPDPRLSPNNCHSPLCSYHDFYVGYDPANHRDLFYGAGAGGYHIYDVSRPDDPRLLTSITGVAGVSFGHTFTPTPDGRYAVAEAEYQYAPLRIFDLKPGLDGQVKAISRPIGAWTADWRDLPHNTEVRWPYVFASTYEDGLQIFNMMDPTNPYTVGYYYTWDGPHQRGFGTDQSPETGTSIYSGAFGVDVRNADGLIVIEDFQTGFWAFKLDGFDGWNGHQWGMPNISSAQDWDHGPDGAPKPVM